MMTTSAEKIRRYRGPAVLSYGFRPFFLFGALWAAIAMVLWLLIHSGNLELPIRMSPVEWHIHELLYGYVPAVVAGFLLTAVPNWTGALPVTGKPLLALFATWVAGRVVMLSSSWIGASFATIVDLSFLAVFLAIVAREIIAGKNVRNLKVLVVVAILFAGNIVFHIEAGMETGPGYGVRVGVGATIALIILIGGRIIPSFTRNWLARRRAGRLPVPFNRFDITVMAASEAALIGWVVEPDHAVTAVLSAVAALLNGLRLSRWAGERTFSEPLVLVLHVGYGFVPIGFVLLALGSAELELVSKTAALHAWTAGAIALMTLAVMTRASLGHTGRQLTATTATQFIYGAAGISAVLRIAAALDGAPTAILHAAGIAWVAAFAGFVVHYCPMLARPVPKKR